MLTFPCPETCPGHGFCWPPWREKKLRVQPEAGP